jgi:hypothetical protein
LKGEFGHERKRIIQDALHLLDSFILSHYQKLDESWLIGKFFGAIYSIVRGSVSTPAYLLSDSFASFNQGTSFIVHGLLPGRD